MDVATYFCLYGLRIVNVLKSASSLTSRLTFNDIQRDGWFLWSYIWKNWPNVQNSLLLQGGKNWHADNQQNYF